MKHFRKEPRIGMNDHICLLKFHDDEPDRKWREVKLRDISVGGLCMAAEDTSFFEGDRVKLKFTLMGKDVIIRGRVVSTYGRKSGVKFAEVSESNQEIINSFVGQYTT